MTTKKILIIEDSASFRKEVKSILKEYKFFEADSVKTALHILKENPDIGVILLDLFLRREKVEGFLEKIKSHSSKYRIIILTGNEKELSARQAEFYGVFNYLPKTEDSLTQSLQFSVAQAFKDLEREHLEEKNNVLIQIQDKINKEIHEGANSAQNIKSLHDVLDLICKSVNDIVGAYTCHIRLFDPSKGDFVLAGFAGPADEIKEIFTGRRRLGEGFSGKVAITKKAETYKDLQKDKRFKEFKEEALTHLALLGQTRQYLDTINSVYIVPFTTRIFDDETDAIFNVSSDHTDFFSEEKKKIVDEFVTQATIAITKAWQAKRKEEAHQDYLGINKVLENVSKELRGENVSDRIYTAAIEGISRIINPEAITIFLFNKRTNALDNVAEYIGNEFVNSLDDNHPIDMGLTGWVFKEGKPLRIPDIQRGNRSKLKELVGKYSKELAKKYVRRLPSGQAEHYLGVPMFIGGKPIGAIQLLNKKSHYYGNPTEDKKMWLLDRGFSKDCENVLGIAASHIAVAIRSANLFEELKRKIGQLNTLKGVGRYTSTEMPLDELLEKIIEEAAHDLNAEICLLFLLDESERRLTLKQRYGIPQDSFLEGAYYELGEGITGKVALTGEAVLIKSASEMPDGKFSKEIVAHLNKKGKSEEETKLESLMVVPIRAKNKILGAIKAIKKKGEGYDEEDLNFFEAFGNYIGIAIENARHYELTNKKLANAEKNAALSFMLRAVVHEINNTEALIPINVQIIKHKLAQENYEIKEMLDVIEDSAKQAVDFANNVQAFSASRIGGREARDINDIINKALKQLEPIFKNNKLHDQVRLIINLSKEPLIRYVYETPLIQVFRNIIINAYQAMEKSLEKNLTITSYDDTNSGLVKIEFFDTGHGIKSEIMEKIFDPEYTTKQGRGSGIGLWLAHTHLKSINADIKVESIVNEGTMFTVQIP